MPMLIQIMDWYHGNIIFFMWHIKGRGRLRQCSSFTQCFWICRILHILICRIDVFYRIHLWGKNLHSLYVPWYLHSCLNVKYSVKCLHSWFPRRRKKVVGCSIFKAHRYSTHWNRKHTKFFQPRALNHKKPKISSVNQNNLD